MLCKLIIIAWVTFFVLVPGSAAVSELLPLPTSSTTIGVSPVEPRWSQWPSGQTRQNYSASDVFRPNTCNRKKHECVARSKLGHFFAALSFHHFPPPKSSKLTLYIITPGQWPWPCANRHVCCGLKAWVKFIAWAVQFLHFKHIMVVSVWLYRGVQK